MRNREREKENEGARTYSSMRITKSAAVTRDFSELN
jgi:hypothetical protein